MWEGKSSPRGSRKTNKSGKVHSSGCACLLPMSAMKAQSIAFAGKEGWGGYWLSIAESLTKVLSSACQLNTKTVLECVWMKERWREEKEQYKNARKLSFHNETDYRLLRKHPSSPPQNLNHRLLILLTFLTSGCACACRQQVQTCALARGNVRCLKRTGGLHGLWWHYRKTEQWMVLSLQTSVTFGASCTTHL